MSVDHFSERIEPTLGDAKISVDRQVEALAERVALPSIPYPGLRSFEIHEACLYFGREKATSELLGKLDGNRFIAVTGPSGSGKSSLVKAGLVPALDADSDSINGSPWAVAVMRPGPAPIRALAAALRERTEGDGDGGEGGKPGMDLLETMLRDTGSGLVRLSQGCRGITGKHLLIVVDQFDDLFRFEKTIAAAAAGEGKEKACEQSAVDEARLFVELLLNATSQDEVPIHVMVTLRTEYLGSCVGFQGLHEAISEGQYKIPPMTREQITQAIFCPAATRDVFFAARLMERLLDDMEDRSDRLCVLQEALTRTWSHWKADPGSGRWLDVHHYEGAGGMAGALSQHADEVFYLGLPDDADRHIAESLFKRLTATGIPGHDGRCPARLGELCAVAAVGTQEMADVITVFRAAGRPFLVSIPDGPLTADSYVDITHESLVFGWRRLRQWMEEEAGSAALYRRLAQTAVLHEKGEAGLWGNPDLKLAEAWYENQAPSPVWAQRYHPQFDVAMAFLEMSKTAARRRKLMVASMLVLVAVVLLALPWRGRSPLSLLGGLGDVAEVTDKPQPPSVASDAGKRPAGQGAMMPGTGAEISRRLPPETRPGVTTATPEAAEIAAFETITGDDKGSAMPSSPAVETPSIVMKIAIPPREPPPGTEPAEEPIGAPAVSQAPAAELAESVSGPPPAAEPSMDSVDPGTDDLAKVLEAALNTDQSSLTRQRDPLPEDAAGSELSAEVQAIAEALLTEPEQASPASATIRSAEDFVLCRQVRHLEPLDIASRFPPGKVYAFAWVQTPKSQERITIKWQGEGGALLGTSQLTVRRNIQRGYRTYAAKTFSAAGRYTVGLYDESERLIGRREFIIE